MLNDTKKWYQSKTIWIAVAQGVAGVLVAIYASNPSLETVGIGATVKSLLDLYLRYTTVTEIK